jgi:hypothetical protein
MSPTDPLETIGSRRAMSEFGGKAEAFARAELYSERSWVTDLSAVAQRAKAEAMPGNLWHRPRMSRSLSSGAHSRDPLAHAGYVPRPAVVRRANRFDLSECPRA